MTSDDNTSIQGSSTPRLPDGVKLAIPLLVVFVLAIVGVVVLYDGSTDPGFRTSAMESRVRAGLPSGWKMTVTESDEQRGPCIDGCAGSGLSVDLTSPEPHASRAVQQRELAAAMRAGGWRYVAPQTRKQDLAAYNRDVATDPYDSADADDDPFGPDDETIGFDPHDAGFFEGAPQATGSRVSYTVNAVWYDGKLSMDLSATPGE